MFGGAFETWLNGQTFNSDQLRLAHLIKEQIKANAAELTVFDSWRFDAPPLSMNGGFESRPCRLRRRSGIRTHPEQHE